MLASLRPAFQAIIYSRQSIHARILTVPEERAMPVVSYSLASPQRPPCAVLVLIFFRFVSAAQLVLVLVLFQKPIGSRKLITDVTHLLFSNMLLPWFILILGHLPETASLLCSSRRCTGPAMLIWNEKFWQVGVKSGNYTTLACGKGFVSTFIVCWARINRPCSIAD